MFKVISVRGNSVRIRTGLVSFDVLVGQNDFISKPKGIYVSDRDMPALVKVVLSAYYTTVNEGTNENETKTSA